MHRIAVCRYVDQLDAQILIMCLYLSLSALHVSDSLVHHQERRFGAVYRNWYKLVRLAVASQQQDVPAHTNCDIQLIKVASNDGLIQSETCRASNEKIKSNHRNFVHLVGLYTYYENITSSVSAFEQFSRTNTNEKSKYRHSFIFFSLRTIVYVLSSSHRNVINYTKRYCIIFH